MRSGHEEGRIDQQILGYTGNRGTISELLVILDVGREETLKQSDR